MNVQETKEYYKEYSSVLLEKLALTGICLITLAFFSTQADAQAGSATPPTVASQTNATPNASRDTDKPVDLFRALNLSPDQQAQIKAIRKQNREARIAAAERVQRALRSLDEAIYADALNDSLIEERRRELAAAQAESVRVETAGQLNIRRLLTLEQLGTLRGLRQRARATRDARRAAQGQPQRTENVGNPNALRPRERFRNRRRNMQGNILNGNNINDPTFVPRERPARPQRRPRP